MAGIGSYIDLGNPVSDHPLNRQLVSWWMPLPNNSNGSRMFDLRGGKHGVLTSGASWTSGRHGWQAVKCDGPDNGTRYVETPSSADYNGANLSVSIWFRDRGGNSDNGGGTTDIRNNDYVIGLGGYNFSTGGWGLTFISTTQVQWSIWNSFADTGFGLVGNAYTTPTGNWTHAVLTSTTTGPSSFGYFNGVVSGSEYTTKTRATTASYIRMAKRPMDGENYTGNVNIASVRVYNRILTAAEVSADYDQGMRGYPDTLRRWSRKSFSFAEGGGGGNRRRRVLLCAGS